jgi:hypothetical protein
MKLIYTNCKGSNQVICLIKHKFDKALTKADQMSMVLFHIIDKYPDAKNEVFYEQGGALNCCIFKP